MDISSKVFRPRTAIVTGASSGIGRASAIALARDGMDVAITWNSNEEGAETTTKAVRELGRRAVAAHLDTASAPGCADVVDSVIDRLGSIDVFVNNAGATISAPFLQLDWETWRKVVAINLDGAFACIQRAALRMVEQGTGGRIIAVTSVHEHQPKVGFAAYSTAKHGLGGLIKNIAIELAQYGITANAVAPGEIDVRASDRGDDIAATDRPGVPLRRPGNSAEIGDVIAFLASPAASYVNGASWTVDGGMLQMGPQGATAIADDGWRTG
ncbi:MAG TPA: SDR family oxidoreductase [Humibacter sp.]|nr:SDR family oxidoreductase [Humibacter sp.]